MTADGGGGSDCGGSDGVPVPEAGPAGRRRARLVLVQLGGGLAQAEQHVVGRQPARPPVRQTRLTTHQAPPSDSQRCSHGTSDTRHKSKKKYIYTVYI